jgi:hypothetical protein
MATPGAIAKSNKNMDSKVKDQTELVKSKPCKFRNSMGSVQSWNTFPRVPGNWPSINYMIIAQIEKFAR